MIWGCHQDWRMCLHKTKINDESLIQEEKRKPACHEPDTVSRGWVDAEARLHRVEKQKFLRKNSTSHSQSSTHKVIRHYFQKILVLGPEEQQCLNTQLDSSPETARASDSQKQEAWNLRDEDNEWPGKLFGLNF